MFIGIRSLECGEDASTWLMDQIIDDNASTNHLLASRPCIPKTLYTGVIPLKAVQVQTSTCRKVILYFAYP